MSTSSISSALANFNPVNADEPQSPPILVADGPEHHGSVQERIINAFQNSLGFCERAEDQTAAGEFYNRLCKSSVHGSFVHGVNDETAVLALLNDVENWKKVQSGKPGITTFQGILPANTEWKAVAAYASIRDICEAYGPAGLAEISVRRGVQRQGEFYLCTTLQMPTRNITVQLRDEENLELLHQWFAGEEVAAQPRKEDGDVLVRCGVRIPLLSDSPRQPHNRPHGYSQGPGHRQGGRRY